MNEQDLEHTLERHETAVTQDSKSIAELKTNVRELLTLIKLLGTFAHKELFLPAQEEASKEFQTRLDAMLQKHEVHQKTT